MNKTQLHIYIYIELLIFTLLLSLYILVVRLHFICICSCYWMCSLESAFIGYDSLVLSPLFCKYVEHLLLRICLSDWQLIDKLLENAEVFKINFWVIPNCSKSLGYSTIGENDKSRLELFAAKWRCTVWQRKDAIFPLCIHGPCGNWWFLVWVWHRNYIWCYFTHSGGKATLLLLLY